jgi:thioesterase domain-containing protein
MTQPVSAPQTQRRVLLQAAGEGRPLFIFPGINGEPLTYTDLASRLGNERPVYAFHHIGMRNECEPVRRVGRLAQLYAAELRGVQPRGPYLLFGYSFGGVLAIEVARELLTHGERVGLVAMADCPAPGYPKPAHPVVRAKLHLQNLLQLSMPERIDYLKDRLGNGFARIQRMVGVKPVAENTDTTPPHIQRVNAGLYEAYENYAPAPLSVDVLFLTADTPPDWPATVFDDPLMGWGPVLRGRISQCGIPGAHLSIFAPENVPVLAERLRNALAQAEHAEISSIKAAASEVRPS